VSSDKIEVRSAHLSDAKQISRLINTFAARDIMLPREEEAIIERIRSFVVAVMGDTVVGCCAVAFFTAELAEIRSLAVDSDFQSKGIGRLLVSKAEEILRSEGVKQAFALTLRADFFHHIGYEIVEKTRFPQKIWRDCLNCPKIMRCDEIAVAKNL
jgi:amino-acid N-acetyltransferase